MRPSLYISYDTCNFICQDFIEDHRRNIFTYPIMYMYERCLDYFLCSILNILYTAAGTAAKYGPVISWTTRVVIYGCAVSFVAGCVVMSVISSPAHSSSKRR